MQRRAFLLATAGGMTAGLPAATSIAASAAESMQPRPIETYVTSLDGLAVEQEGNLQTDSLVRLLPAPDRAYDSRSVAVQSQSGRHLGYLPQRDARILEPLLASGFKFEARITRRRSLPRPRIDLQLVPTA